MNLDTNINNADNYMINNKKTTKSKSFEYKTKIIGRIPIYNNSLNAKSFVQLNYLRDF